MFHHHYNYIIITDGYSLVYQVHGSHSHMSCPIIRKIFIDVRIWFLNFYFWSTNNDFLMIDELVRVNEHSNNCVDLPYFHTVLFILFVWSDEMRWCLVWCIIFISVLHVSLLLSYLGARVRSILIWAECWIYTWL